MHDGVSAWLTDWRHVALAIGIAAAIILLLYMARRWAHRFIDAIFFAVANVLRLVGRYVDAVGRRAMTRYTLLACGLKEQELQPRIPDDVAYALKELRHLAEAFPQIKDRVETQLFEIKEEYRVGSWAATLESIRNIEVRSEARSRLAEQRKALSRVARAIPSLETPLHKLQGLDERCRAYVDRVVTNVSLHRDLLTQYGNALSAGAAGSSPPPGIGLSIGVRVVFALIVIVIAGAGAVFNFALLERPMAEVVGDAYRVAGMPIYRLAAMILIFIEMAVGLILLETIGFTTMFSVFERLDHRPKLRAVLVVALVFFLFVLATTEAVLALTRDDISRLDREVAAMLTGVGAAATGDVIGSLPRWAQAALGFVIPFILALLGFAIEALFNNGRVVLQLILGLTLQGMAFLVRLARQGVLGMRWILITLYDLLIFIPLFFETAAAARRAGSSSSR